MAINPDYLVGGTTEDDALVAVNDARAVIVAKMSGGSTGADGGGADAGQAEEAGLDPLLSLHDFDLKTAKKPELEALVGQHRSWTAGTNPGRKGLVWTQRAEGAAAGATAQPDGAVGAGAAAGATAAATGGAAAGAAPPAAPAAATEAAIPGAAAAAAAPAAEPALSAGEKEEKDRIGKLKVAELKEELKALKLRTSGLKADLAKRLFAKEDEQPAAGSGGGDSADGPIGKKRWLLARAAEMLRTGSQRGVLLSAAVEVVLQWSKDQISAAAVADIADQNLPKCVELPTAKRAAELALIATLNTLEKKKQVARDRHGPFYSAKLLRLDKLNAKQVDAVVEWALADGRTSEAMPGGAAPVGAAAGADPEHRAKLDPAAGDRRRWLPAAEQGRRAGGGGGGGRGAAANVPIQGAASRSGRGGAVSAAATPRQVAIAMLMELEEPTV